MAKPKKLLWTVILILVILGSLSFAACGEIVFKIHFYETYNAETNKYTKQTEIIEVEEGEEFDIPDDPTRTGYVFEGWYYLLSGVETPFNADVQIGGNIKVYAKWHQLPPAPAGLKFNKYTDPTTLSWTAVNGATGYEIALTESQKESESGLVIINDPATTSYPLTTYGDYVVFIRTVANDEKSAWSKTAVVFSIEAPKAHVTFRVDGNIYETVEIIDGKVILPDDPNNSENRRFIDWYLDANGTQKFDADDVGNTSINVYAKWIVKPNLVAADFEYFPAKASETQSIIINDTNDDDDVKSYTLIIKDSSGEEIETLSNTFAEGKSFNLKKELYTNGEFYTITVIVTSNNQWYDDEDNLVDMTKQRDRTIKYAIVLNEKLKVSFIVENVVFFPDYIASGGYVGQPLIIPTRTGYIFDEWVTETGEPFDFENTPIVEDTDIYASWIARPNAPQSASYKDDTLTLSWDAIAGVTLYQYRIDNDQTVKTVTGNSLQLFGLTKGTHKIYFKITEGGIDSEWSQATFTVTDIYIAVNANNGTPAVYVKVDANNKIPTPATVSREGCQFVKWSFDSLILLYEGNPGGSVISFGTQTFSATAQIYAQWYEKPNEVTAGVWNERSENDPDTLTIIDEEDAQYYYYKWSDANGVTATKLEGKVLDLSPFYLSDGVKTIYIQSVNVINNLEVKSSFKEISFTVVYTTELIRYEELPLIREKDKDGTTFIFYAGQRYTFANTVFEGNSDRYSLVGDTGNTIQFNNTLGEIEGGLTFDYDGVPTIWKAKVVPRVTGMNYGENYGNYISASKESELFIKSGNAYEVGLSKVEYSSEYFIDLVALTPPSTPYVQNQLNLSFSYKYSNGSDADGFGAIYDEESGKYYLTINGSIADKKGKTLVITVVPKYLDNAQFADVEDFTIEFRLKLNDGVNVYTNAQLKAAFEDTSVKNINIHSDITAEFAPDQVNGDKTAVNYTVGSVSEAVKADGNYIYSVKTYDLAKCFNSSVANTQTACDAVLSGKTVAEIKDAIAELQNQGKARRVIAANVYYRFVKNTNDDLVVNGNYFTIDSGSAENELRKVSNAAEGWTQVWYGQNVCNGTPSYKVQGVQTAMFLVQNLSQGNTVNVTYKNLEIDGNTKLIGNDSASVTLYSGGMNGFMARRSTMNCDNTVAREFTIAYFFDNDGSVKNNYSYITDSLADANWANGIYSSGTAAITLKNSRFLRCSGAAVHIEDADEKRNTNNSIDGSTPPSGIPLYDNTTNGVNEVRYDPALIIYDDTVMENWVTGEEAWFTAWGVSAMVPPLKMGLQSNAQTKFGQSIIKIIDSVEKINFAFMMMPIRDKSQIEICIKKVGGTSADDIKYTLVSNTSPEENAAHTLPYNYDLRYQEPTLDDPRGMLLTPVGATADTIWAVQAGAYMTGLATSNMTQYNNLVALYGPKLTEEQKTAIPAIFTNYGPEAVLYMDCIDAITASNAANIGGSQFFQLAMSGADIGAGTASGPSSLAYIWLSYGNGDTWYFGS